MNEHAADTPAHSQEGHAASAPEPASRLGPPKHPADAGSIDELAASYNFQNTCGFHELFARTMATELRVIRSRLAGDPLRAVNIGCGTGIGRNADYLLAIDDEIDEHWGVEPDESIEAPEIFEHFQHALAETADLPEAYFDVAYSAMVVEHVANPDAFMGAIARCLKPGGVHIFMTVNGAHYFARAAWLMNRMHVEDFALRLVRGKQEVSGYHYPVQYRMNKASQIAALAEKHGFKQPVNVFVENEGPRPYFPGPLRLFYNAMQSKRRKGSDGGILLTLISKMERV